MTVFQLGPLRLAQFAFDARPARQKTAHVNDAAAGTAAQPVDWPCELLRLDRGTAQNPGRLEQIVDVAGAIVGIDHRAGSRRRRDRSGQRRRRWCRAIRRIFPRSGDAGSRRR
ncbi:hypothetical protein [Mesorhizobium sp. M4B.F.Ca.ET.089.01.1.1]|uniref:hypothetical protein n=1 Tax=Mesorhizobium sp. M4B.F.Ca.ET.089.01.1.1 TaxID=2496662 RepID=UPI001AEC9A47|nr:hypothetical protein [Mesorhizobium sp. M4B.F.Ca.ET.089.01.1.1]